MAARIVTRTKSSSSISPVLKSLHWLQIRERIDFKILTLTYQAYHKTGPAYLQDLITAYIPSRPLRSQDQLLLSVPTYKLKSFGAKSFQYAAATLWNSLPLDLKLVPTLSGFKRGLKTHLFRRYP